MDACDAIDKNRESAAFFIPGEVVEAARAELRPESTKDSESLQKDGGIVAADETIQEPTKSKRKVIADKTLGIRAGESVDEFRERGVASGFLREVLEKES